MLKSLLTKQFVLFLFVGAVSAALNILSRIFFNQWLSYFDSIILGYCMGISLAFTLNYYLVFPGANKSIAKQLLGFITTNLFFLPIVLLSSIFLNNLFLSLGYITFTQLIAHIISVSLPLLSSFLIYKFLTFK